MLISVALDFHNATVRTRERFHLSDGRVEALFAGARGGLVRELAVLATCNRLELYAWTLARTPAEALEAGEDLIDRWVGADQAHRPELEALVQRRDGADAAAHLMRVASGLESQILGDVQILGQVRRAYRQAVESGGIGTGLHRVFGAALHAAKRVQRETGLIGGRHSVGAEAASLAARRSGPLVKRRCVVIGCGKTGERTARQLVKLGATDVVLINRSPDRAEQLARDLWGRAAAWDRLHRELARADIGVIATSAERPPILAGSLRFCRDQAGTGSRPLLLIDLSVPRNVEAEVAGLAGVTLLDLDALHPPLAQAEALRRAAVPRAEEIVAEELHALLTWVRAEAAREALRPLREALEHVCRRELAYAGAETGADLDRAASRIVAKLMAGPMTALRRATLRGESVDGVSQTLQSLFRAEAIAVEAE